MICIIMVPASRIITHNPYIVMESGASGVVALVLGKARPVEHSLDLGDEFE